VIPLQKAGDKAALNEAIRSIQSGGSTNLAGGWMLGRDELKQAPKECMKRLLLLSDGQLNHGIVEPAAVQQVVASGLEQDQIRTSCLGFGESYDEDLMAEMSRITSGRFYDANSAENLPAIFTSELEGLQSLAVQNLRLRVRRLDFCASIDALGEYPPLDLPDGRKEYAIGDLVSSESRVVCFGVSVLPLPAVNGKPVVSLEGEQLLEMEILFDELGTNEVTSKSHKQIIRIMATQDPAEVQENAQVVSWVAMQRAAGVIRDVTKLMDAQHIDEAIKTLNKALDDLQRYGGADNVKEALQLLDNLKGKIQDNGWNLRERKLSRYRSAQYSKMSSKDLWVADEAAPSFNENKIRPSSSQTDPGTKPEP
jgi:Ca-activated chloride channel family protein